MKNLISQMSEENEFIKYKKNKNKPKIYTGNLANLRQKRVRMIEKKHQLTLEIKQYNKMTHFEREEIFKDLYSISVQISHINKEIAKVQKGMQNNNQWMDGDYNSINI